MSAKVIYSFTDENPDLQKQIGCMNGIFQLFDRQHFLTGRRASHKSLPPVGQSENEDKQTSRTLQKSKDSNPKKEAKEKHRTSTESSRTSFSSSTCSSTFSSLDCNKIALVEPSKQLGHKSFDLRDIVKESMNKEVRGLSVNTVSKEPERHTMKHIDSPRPFQLSKPMKPRVLTLKESSRSPVMSTDAPRFSYDGRESREKGNIKLKELPRLSLDSRVSPSRRLSYEFKTNNLTGFQMENEKIRRGIINPHEETGSYKRPSSVVAKLMGLDALPNSMLSNEGNNMDEMRISCSPRNRQRGDTSQSPTLKNLESPIKAQNSCHSVYGEIEKRLADLEFRKSGKDLRALKQILQAMQKTKETLETKQNQTCSSPSLSTQDHGSKIENQRNLRNKPPISSIVKQTSPRKNSGSATVIMKPATLARKYEIKPIEGISDLHKLRSGDLTDKQASKDRTFAPRDSTRGTSDRLQCSTDKSFRTRIKAPETSGKSSGSLSPRLQCKQSRPTTPLSDSNRPIRESSRHLIELNSHKRKIRLSSPNYKNSTRSLSQQSDENSLKSESSSSFLSQMDAEISSTENYEEIISHKHRNPNTPEQPSPVSVLDAMFYRDDLPSPVKMISHDFDDDGALFSDEPFWTSANLHQIPNSVESNLSVDIEQLVQNKTEDHKYISKIFLASRLLFRDISYCLMSTQLHPTDYIISPDLFFALEQISSEKSKSLLKDKIHKKLIFDTVNEILVGKLTGGKTTNGQQLLKEVCSEIDQLQTNNSSNSNLDDDSDFFSNLLREDLKKQSSSWTALGSDVSGLVLDIERSIFKDLVTEIVNEEATGMRTRIGGHGRRKLFAR